MSLTSTSTGGGLLDFGGGGRQRVHVQSLAANKGREALAEDVVALREQVTRLREEVVGGWAVGGWCTSQ
jgi:hypothetical protein